MTHTPHTTGPGIDTAPGTGTASRPPYAADADERLRRWRLVLGGGAAEGTGCELSGRDAAMDRTLGALYGGGRSGQGESGERSGRPAWAVRRPGWPAGWVTSGRTSRVPSSR